MVKLNSVVFFVIAQSICAMDSEKESKRWEQTSQSIIKEEQVQKSTQGNSGVTPAAIKQTHSPEGLRLRKPKVKNIEKK
jgi:hypothetical protein